MKNEFPFKIICFFTIKNRQKPGRSCRHKEMGSQGADLRFHGIFGNLYLKMQQIMTALDFGVNSDNIVIFNLSERTLRKRYHVSRW